MDPLSDILALLQPQTYATGGLSAGGDWGVRFPAHGMIKCYSVVRGECRLTVDNIAEPIRLRTGSCFLLPRGWPFSLSSGPAQPPAAWETLSQQERYNGILPLTPGDDFIILGSHFRLEGNARFLLDALPPILLLESEAQRETLRWAVDRLLREMRDSQPGSTLIAQQIACTMLVEALRLHVAKRRRARSRMAGCACRSTLARGPVIHPSRTGSAMDLGRSGSRSRNVANRFCAALQADDWQAAHGVPKGLAHELSCEAAQRAE